MDTNITAHYLATRAEHELLVARAERGWRRQQALASLSGERRARSLRRLIGAAVVSAGRRIEGMPSTPVIIVEPKHVR